MKEKGKNKAEDRLRIKDFPRAERPRERLVSVGAQALSDAELLAILLKTGRAGENALDLARRVLALSWNGSLSGLYDMRLEELQRVEGIGPAKAAQIAAACELAGRIGFDKSDRKKTRITGISQLGEMLTARLKWLNKEVFEVVTVDCRWNLLNTVRVSVGSLGETVVHPREVFVEALKSYCAAVVLVHNHPSGDPTPSREDLRTTERLVRAGRLIGIEVADHIITGSNSFYSMHLWGDMERIRKRCGPSP